MEYQKILSLLDNIPNQLSKFKTKNRVEMLVTPVNCITPIVKLCSNLQC